MPKDYTPTPESGKSLPGRKFAQETREMVNELEGEMNANAAALNVSIEEARDAATEAREAAAATQGNLDIHTADRTPHGATSAPTEGRIPLYGFEGTLNAGTPTAAGNVATKGYVDGMAADLTADIDAAQGAADNAGDAANAAQNTADGAQTAANTAGNTASSALSQANTNAGAITGLQGAINGIIADQALEQHFRGYFSTTNEIATLPDPKDGDYAFNAETGTKWAYDEGSWIDTLDAVPDQTVPASDTTPLMDGTAAAGTSEEYARGDHTHPTDTGRAPTSHTHTASQITDFPASLPANGGSADTAAKLATARNINGIPFDGTADILTALNNVVIQTSVGNEVNLDTLINGRWSFVARGGLLNAPIAITTDMWCYAVVWGRQTFNYDKVQFFTINFNDWWVRNFSGGSSTWSAWAVVGRRKATDNTHFHVSLSGSDSNDGTSVANAMLTVNALLTRMVREWDFQGYEATINIAAGTYTNYTIYCNSRVFVGLSALHIVGAGRENTIIDSNGANAVSISNTNCNVNVRNLKVVNYYHAFTGGDMSHVTSIEHVEIGTPNAAIYPIHFGTTRITFNNIYFTAAFQERLFIAATDSFFTFGGTIDIGTQTKVPFYAYGKSIMQFLSDTVLAGTTTAAAFALYQNSLLYKGGNTFPGTEGVYDSTSAAFA
jgi:hypothetical protein